MEHSLKDHDQVLMAGEDAPCIESFLAHTKRPGEG